MTERPTRKLTDPQTLRALSHPTRLAMIEIIGADGTATATRCAEVTGESVASCSYHLGMLAKYGFVVPAEGGDGREKPWKLTENSHSWSSSEGDEATQMAAEALSEVHIDHSAEQFKKAIRRVSREPEDWRAATSSSSGLLYLTAAEAKALTEELTETARRWHERIDDPSLRPEGARPVHVFLASWTPYPIEKEKES
jgi:predicted ArsR family transcriptional regulator